MKTSLIVLFSFLLSIGYTQDLQIIDSLKQELANAKHDTSRVLWMSQIASNYRAGSADSTLYYGNKALELANKSNFLRGKVRAMSYLSIVYQNSGNLPKALEILLKALKFAENNFFREEEGMVANRLGNLYLELRDFSKALIYFKRSILILEEINKESGYLYCLELMNIGSQFEGLNQLDSAEYYFQKSLQAFKKNKFETPPHLYRHLGNVRFALGNMPLALFYYKRSLQSKTIENTPAFYTTTLNALSIYYQKANNLDSSIYYAKQALIQARLISSKNRAIIGAAFQLSKLYETINTDEAFRYYKMAVETRDSLYGKNSLEAIQAIADQEEEQQRAIEANKIRYQTKPLWT